MLFHCAIFCVTWFIQQEHLEVLTLSISCGMTHKAYYQRERKIRRRKWIRLGKSWRGKFRRDSSRQTGTLQSGGRRSDRNQLSSVAWASCACNHLRLSREQKPASFFQLMRMIDRWHFFARNSLKKNFGTVQKAQHALGTHMDVATQHVYVSCCNARSRCTHAVP